MELKLNPFASHHAKGPVNSPLHGMIDVNKSVFSFLYFSQNLSNIWI